MSMASVQTVKHHVARINHRCCECSGIIAPLDVYERTWGIWDGIPYTFKTCGHCEEARDWLLNETDWKQHEMVEDGGHFEFGGLRQHLRDVVTEIDGKLLFPAYRRIVEMKRRQKAAMAIFSQTVPFAGGEL